MTDNDQTKYLYIDEEVNVYEGEKAAALILNKADRDNVDPNRGIVRVSRERWQEAQRYERRTWLEKAIEVNTDRNEYHCEHFASYAPIRGFAFTRAIELGCGPFTNMRLILAHCDVKELYLLDPLITDYLNHPHCRYKDGILRDKIPINRHFVQNLRHPLRYLKYKLRSEQSYGFQEKPVNLVASMIEDYKTDLQFDLVVMINVIEHCQDAEVVLNKILDLLRPGGIFVNADKIYSAQKVKEMSMQLYDAGHPLRVDQSLINDFIDRNFEPLMNANYSADQNFQDLAMDSFEQYFIGRRHTPK